MLVESLVPQNIFLISPITSCSVGKAGSPKLSIHNKLTKVRYPWDAKLISDRFISSQILCPHHAFISYSLHSGETHLKNIEQLSNTGCLWIVFCPIFYVLHQTPFKYIYICKYFRSKWREGAFNLCIHFRQICWNNYCMLNATKSIDSCGVWLSYNGWWHQKIRRSSRSSFVGKSVIYIL